MKLCQSPVQYNRESHTYTLNGVRLCGVTEMIKYQLQPESYSGISEEVLLKAAKKGSWVHDLCESFDIWGDIPGDTEVEALENSLVERGINPEDEVGFMRNAIISVTEYSKLVAKHKLVHQASEYVVTDGKHFASPIDKVYMVDENTVDIYDIKTISSLDKAALEKVTWQCSIYAKWFEELNPSIKVRNIGVVWLPDQKYWTKAKKPSVKVLQRVPDEEVQKLLDAEVNGEKYRENSVPRGDREKAVVKADANVPAEIQQLKDYVVMTINQFKQAESQKKDMLEKVKSAMAQFNIKSWSTEDFVFVQAADSERKTLDVAALAADHPELDLSKYYKTSTVKGAFSVKSK